MNEAAHSRLCSYPERRVRLADVQRELDALWEEGRRPLTQDQAVTRACMSNLLIYCDDDQQGEQVARAIPDIVISHPARVVLLTGCGDTSEPGIEVHVSGHYRLLPGGLQVSAEQIKVVADAQAGDRLPSVARSQIIGDLPTTLWWASRQPPPFAGKLFHQLTELSDQIIYDSFGWTRPTEGMQAMSRWVAAQRSEYVIYNLAWRRLSHWRSLISQVFDPAVLPGALSGVTGLRIEHGPHAVAMTALLVGWLASRLGWQVEEGKVMQGRQTVWQFSSSGRRFPVYLTRLEQAPSGPVCVAWDWRDGGHDQRSKLADLGDGRLAVVDPDSGQTLRTLNAPQPGLGQLLAGQMAYRSRDRLFEQALATGNSMTRVLI